MDVRIPNNEFKCVSETYIAHKAMGSQMILLTYLLRGFCFNFTQIISFREPSRDITTHGLCRQR